MDAIRTISLDDTLCAAFCVEGRAPHIEDRDESCVLCAAVIGLASHARAPLYHHDVCIGELHVGSLTRHAFSQAEKELLTAVGNEVGTVIAKLQADDALKESEQRFRELTDALPVLVYEADATGRVTFANATSFDLFGYTKEELEAGISVFELVTDADKGRADTVFRRRMRGEDVGRIEYAGLRKDGSTFPVSALGAPIRLDGAVVGVRGIIVDITERKQTEEALHEREEMLQLILNASEDAICLLDTDGVFQTANEALARRFGVTPAEVIGMKGFTEKPKVVSKQRRAHFARAIATKLPVHFDDEHAGRRLESVYYPIVDARGNVTKVAVFSRDVTERIHAQEELKRQRDQAQLYLDTANVTMVALNREGRITLLNRNGCELLGVTPEEAVGTDWFKTFLPEDVRTEMWGVFETLMAGDWGMYSYYENPVLTSRGEERIVAWHTSLLNDDRGNVIGALNSGTDVTERVRADQKLRESEQRFRELTDALPVGVYETYKTGRFPFVNAAFLAQSGYKREGLEAGMSVFQLIAPADRERARTAVRRRMSGEDVGQIEYAGLRKDGSTFPVVARGAQIRRDGAVVGIRGIAADMTEQKRAEETVKEHTHTIEILNHIMTEGHRAFGVQSFAKTVTTLTLGLLHFDAGTIHLADDDARCAKLRYVTGLPDSAVEAIREIPLNKPPYAGFLVEPKPLFLDGHEVSRVPHVAELGLKSFAVVPLYRYDEIIGALNVGSFKRHTFSQAEKYLLNAIGNEVGVVIAKLQADEALKESERRIREITDALPVVVYETDGTGRLTFVNATAFDLFGYTKEELEAGMTVFQLFTDAYKERAHTVFRRRMSGEDVGRIEYAGLRKDGSTFPVSIRAVLMRRDGAIVGMRGIIVDIAERKRAEDEIKASLKERETLLKEIHHRVKNNMQVVSSLLSLQAAQATEPETIEILDESQRQIRSMALIHEKLYRSDSLAEIDFGDYVKSLVDDLLQMYNVPGGAITIAVDIENVQLGVDTAIPCGLIINELVSNSLKYAFPDGRTGDVTVALQRANGVHTLTVADDGVGFPADLDFRATDSLGMQLVTALVNQLEGTITLDRTKGTTFIITFKSEGARVEKSGGE